MKLSRWIPRVAILILYAASALTASATYTITDLGLGQAYAINDSGQVAGLAGTSLFQAFSYSNGVKTVFGNSFGRSFSRGWDINNSGVIAGSAYNDPTGNGSIGFTWKNGSGTTIPLDNGFAVNDFGTVAGSRVNGSIVNAATDSNGIVTDLGTLGGNVSFAYGINNAGQVVGRARDSSGLDRAFLWRNGSMTPLSATSSEAQDINSLGQIVGVNKIASGAMHATLWQNGATIDLDTLHTPDSYAYAINNSGTVVGYAGFAFIYQNGQMQYLNDLIAPNSGWTLYNALDINNNGQIVGYGTLAGQTHAFLLTPAATSVPLPAPAPFLAITTAGLWLYWRKASKLGSSKGTRSPVLHQENGKQLQTVTQGDVNGNAAGQS